MSQTTGMAPPVWYREEVSLQHFGLLRADTRALVGALMMGAVFTLTEQFMERIDTVLTGGALPWFGVAIGPIFMVVSPWLFGFWGGQITGNFNPIFAVLTATNPIAPMFFLFNTTTNGMLAFLVNAYKQRGHKTVTFGPYFGLTMLSFQCIMALLVVLWSVLLKLPGNLIGTYFVLMELACIVATFLSWFAFRAIVKAGFVD